MEASFKRLLPVLLLLTLPPAMEAQFIYTTNSGALTITGYTGSGGAVTIPSETNGLPVTSIGDYAFGWCSKLTSVTILDNVTNIGGHAFIDCYGLTSVTIGNSVSSIGPYAFADCYSLTRVAIPNSVTNIGNGAFGGCSSLTNLTMGSNVTSIGQGAFDSTSLTSVTIPDRVTTIGYEAFAGCTSLTAIMVDAPNSVYSSLDGVLFNKSQTMLIQCPGGKAGAYTIPNGVTNVGDYAFSECVSLTSLTIPSSVTYLGDYAFQGCDSLGNVTIGSSVTSIGEQAFYDCTNLTRITIPNSVTSIGQGAFESCTSLTNLTIGDGVTSIGDYAFDFCPSLTSVTLGNSVASIGWQAFSECTSLTSITIPDSVASIETFAFSDCPSLASVTIGADVTSIESDAFYDCPSLTGVYFRGNAPSLGNSYVFYGDNNATVYFLPGTTGWGTTFGGLPTALWIQDPIIQMPPQTQTAELRSNIGLRVQANGSSPLFCLWYLNDTNLISCSTNCALELTNVQFAQSGAYTVVISNALGAVTSAPAMLNVIGAVERRPIPGVKVTGEAGRLLNVDCADSLSPAPNWTTLGAFSLTGTSQYCLDLTLPLPPQRFYRAWRTGTPGVMPSLDLHLVPALTLTGNLGGSVRLDYINRFGPTDAWVTLDTVTLTNTSQLYFDVSAPGQPQRLYRLSHVP